MQVLQEFLPVPPLLAIVNDYLMETFDQMMLRKGWVIYAIWRNGAPKVPAYLFCEYCGNVVRCLYNWCDYCCPKDFDNFHNHFKRIRRIVRIKG